MSGARVRSVHDIEIDEVSLVDRPANQHAALVIAKRAGGADMGMGEDNEPDEVYTLDGQLVTDYSHLTEGQEVVDRDGNRFAYVLDDDEGDEDDEGEFEADPADSAFLAGAGQATVGKSLADTFRAELAKAQTSDDVRGLLAKMTTTLAVADQRITQAEYRAEQAESVAKSEQELRLTAAYISKAAELNVPVDPSQLGPVLMRMEQQMSHEDCLVIAKALTAAGEMLFAEIGFQAGDDGADPLATALAGAGDQIAKGQDPGLALEEYFERNPGAYADYLGR